MTCPCPDCPKAFADKISLQDHHRRLHRTPTIQCLHCGYQTKLKSNLVRHMNVHVNGVTPVYRRRKGLREPFLKCCMCETFQCQERHQMVKHYTAVHDVPVVEETLEFGGVEEFLTWKEHTEKSECFRFVLKGKRKGKNHNTNWYRCFRDGYFHSKGANKRRLKKNGSCKINSVCPCSLKAVTCKNTGAVSGKYVSRHVGHGEDLGRMNLSQEEKCSIADKLSQRIPFDVVLDSIRESITGSKSSRIHPTSKADEKSDNVLTEFVDGVTSRNRSLNEEASQDIERCKTSLSKYFAAILQTAENMTHIDIIRNAIAPIPHSIKAASSALVVNPRE